MVVWGWWEPLRCAHCSSSDGGGQANPGAGGEAGAAGQAGAAGSAGVAGAGGSGVDTCPSEGATQCDSLLVQVCEATSTGLAWAEPMACASPMERCRDGACTPPTATQLEQLDSIDTYVDALVNRSAWYEPLDGFALRAIGNDTLLAGDGDDATYYRALRLVQEAVLQGHQSIYPATGCGTAPLPVSSTSRFGVCGRPRGSEIVVTVARDGNLLDLAPGDVIESLDGTKGVPLFEEISHRVVCTASSPTEAHLRGNAATTFFAAIGPGETLPRPVGRRDGARCRGSGTGRRNAHGLPGSFGTRH